MYSNFVKLVNKIKNSYKKYKKKDNVEYVKQLIDDFDHIACDNVLISKEFIAHFFKEKKRGDYKSATFAYYESLYYLKSASDKIKRVLDNGEHCINNKNTVVSLDIYRLTNLYSMMVDIFNLIKNNRNDILIEKELSKILDRQINLVEEMLVEIENQSKKYIYDLSA